MQGGLAEVLLRLQSEVDTNVAIGLSVNAHQKKIFFTELAHVRPKSDNKTRTSLPFYKLLDLFKAIFWFRANLTDSVWN